MEFTAGEPVPDAYVPLLEEELGLGGVDLRSPQWHKDDIDADRPFLVAIVGAGMSGIAAGVRLGQAGVPYVIVEKNGDVGGTWLENTYPGCRVDVSNHLFSYSFAQRHDWPQHFSSQEVLLDYFRDCAERFGVTSNIRFNTEVVSIVWSAHDTNWRLQLDGPDGPEVMEADAVVSAVGQLNRPNMPDIAGMDAFAGSSFHSAQWDHSVDLRSKRVAVIGTGCSSAQLVPIVADDVSELRVFQRTPNWFIPTPEYHDDIGAGLAWLFGHLPFYSEWYRFWLFWRSADGLLPSVKVDPTWRGDDRSVSALNDELRLLLTEYYKVVFADRPDLLEAALPHYPPASKRVIRDNGVWPATLKRDNVEFVTDDIVRVTATGIETADGNHHDADVIIYGTGFLASKFLAPMKVVGRNGVDLHERWDGNARAYLGITIPTSRPSFVCTGRTRTSSSTAASSTSRSARCTTWERPSGTCSRPATPLSTAAKTCTTPTTFASTRETFRWPGAFQRSTAGTRAESGRVAQNWPFSLLEYWQQTREINPPTTTFCSDFGTRNQSNRCACGARSSVVLVAVGWRRPLEPEPLGRRVSLRLLRQRRHRFAKARAADRIGHMGTVAHWWGHRRTAQRSFQSPLHDAGNACRDRPADGRCRRTRRHRLDSGLDGLSVSRHHRDRLGDRHGHPASDHPRPRR